jgi:hypothetical protein
MQEDPLDRPGDLRDANRYAYAASDPVNFVDPAGTQITPCATKPKNIKGLGGTPGNSCINGPGGVSEKTAGVTCRVTYAVVGGVVGKLVGGVIGGEVGHATCPD